MSDSNPLGALSGLMGALGGGGEAGGLDVNKVLADLAGGEGDAKARLVQSFQSLAPQGAAPSEAATSNFVGSLQGALLPALAGLAGGGGGQGGGMAGLLGGAVSALTGGGSGAASGGVLKAIQAILPIIAKLFKKPSVTSPEATEGLSAIGQQLGGIGVAPAQSNQVLDALKKMLAESAAKAGK
jgi:hypothetical protein